ncbi:tRNA (adenosine(37)-N6)-threonylcarbamoyltransferase complex ATPase subunit type 1 TsaE [Pararhodonellum marinum]|uniref:tRNA (adenosine(37)-N6)-threonylcarbamoyltransferase complex ATPase subunit type 1 TsaE n=1 Tax=Pararhodonellum marinum TaxID=2755358 RepID=UPI00188FAE42|nr:tRNA (adenosine(37)-N6)-threonylcarbamoyltransferase complex ATPase subunit type 1 TsaE [Pararhodonellum marinum]
MYKIYCKSIAQISLTAEKIISFGANDKIWIFKGDMGAGKTTLIKEIARKLGVIDPVSSPSFSIVNEYEDNLGNTYFHFDFYRIENQEEVMEIGVEEYFYSNNYCWIEWAEKIPDFIPDRFLLIHIVVDEDNARIITLKEVRNEC